jgi:ssDNA-binding replication factor A large subunit
MDEANYFRVLDKISRVSGIEKEEIERRVEAKRAKLAGLISREGAAQVVAAELGIDFDKEKLKIEELLPGMRKVNTVGKIIFVSPVRTFTTKKGDEGKVCNLIIADDTSNIKVVLWDTNHIELIEKGNLDKESVIEISGGSMRDNELHLGSFSELKPSSEIIEKVKTEKVVREKTISELRIGDNSKIRAFVMQSFEPRFFYICPECKKKVVSGNEGFICTEHNKITPEKRALINVIIDDGTETIRTVLFHEQIPKIGITELENPERLLSQREDLLGKEMIFFGTVRNNKFFNNIEFIADDITEVDLDKLIQNLENK